MADPNPPLWWTIVTLPIVAFLWLCLRSVEAINWLVRLAK